MTGLYERIGQGYARVRYADPHIQAHLDAALGDARTVVNIGAGTGNYEPSDRRVVAVEPAALMVAQRPPRSAPAVRAVAEALPFRDLAFDAGLAINTVHHWRDLAQGLRELRRVARRQVIFICEPAVVRNLWVVDYFPGIPSVPSEETVSVADLRRYFAVVSVKAVPVPGDCVDGFTAAFWRRPEAYLEPAVRAAMSPLAQLSPAELALGVERLRYDLCSGNWDARYGHLRQLSEYDAGYRIVTADGAARSLSGRE